MLAHPALDVLTVAECDDIDQARDGRSRYGAYLRLHRHMFTACDDTPTTEPAEFAAAAFEVACGPIMSPAYVQTHPRVQNVWPALDDERRLALTAVLAIPAPAAAAHLQSQWRGWTCDHYSNRWRDPYNNVHTTVLTAIAVRVSVVVDALPTPAYRADVADTATAKHAVHELCDQLNAELGGMLARLDGVEVTR
ncbi:MAG: hypothetical protein ACRDRL_07220 [Sciscionella sp.]